MTIRDNPLGTYDFSPIDGNLLRIGLPLARLRSTLATSLAVRSLSRLGVTVGYT